MTAGQAVGVVLVAPDGTELGALETLFASVHLPTQHFRSAADLLDASSKSSRGCIVAHTTALHTDTATFQRRLRESGSYLPVIYVAPAPDATVAVAVAALKAGAADFLELPCNGQTLLDAVNDAIDSNHRATQRRLTKQRMAQRFGTLTPREWDLVEPMVRCWTNRRIARRLGISEKTVEAYRARVIRKTGAEDMPELMRMAIRAGLLDDPQHERDSDR